MSTVYWPFSRGFDFGSFDLGMRIIVRLFFLGGGTYVRFQVGHSMAHLWNYAMA